MKRAVLIVLLAGCGFAQKHPGVTVGVVAGTIGFGACGLAVEELKTCSLIGAVAGLALGGITGLITTFTDTSAHELPPLQEETDADPFVRRVRTKTEPPPGLPVDAGVPLAVDAGAGDAGM